MADKTNLSSSTECRCYCHCTGTDACRYQQKGHTYTNCVHCQPDTDTQRDDSKQEQEIRDDLFADLTRFKSEQISVYDLMEKILSCAKLKRYFQGKVPQGDDSIKPTKLVESSSKVGVDSMKKQIAEILANQYGMIVYPAVDDIAALFQSQESKTLERVREITKYDVGAIPETNDYANGWNACRQEVYQLIKKPLLELLEAEQKGSK